SCVPSFSHHDIYNHTQHTLFFSRRRRHTKCISDWSSDVCSSDLAEHPNGLGERPAAVRIEPEARPCSERLAHRRDLHEILRVVRSEERRVGKECRWHIT